MINSLISIVLAAGCAIPLAVVTAQAQTADMHRSMNAPRMNPGDLKARILRECGPITNAHLRAGCIDNIDLSERQPSAGWHERMTGSSTGPMNSTGPTFYAPNMNEVGSGR